MFLRAFLPFRTVPSAHQAMRRQSAQGLPGPPEWDTVWHQALDQTFRVRWRPRIRAVDSGQGVKVK